MRCNNCGWENLPGNQKCEKCNAPLNGSMVSNNDSSHRKYASVAEVFKSTVPETGRIAEQKKENNSVPMNENNICSDCGYPVSAGMNVCPHCGQKLKGQKKNEVPIPKAEKACPECGTNISFGAKFCSNCGTPLRMGTISPWNTPDETCTLKPLPRTGEKVVFQPISYSGTSISLNRANTDTNNNTITSKEQAVLIHESDGWYIEDRSELHTTFIKVDKKRKLENEDVIVLGNRLFEFKS